MVMLDEIFLSEAILILNIFDDNPLYTIKSALNTVQSVCLIGVTYVWVPYECN